MCGSASEWLVLHGVLRTGTVRANKIACVGQEPNSKEGRLIMKNKD